MTKADLASGIHAQLGLTKSESLEYVEALFSTIRDVLVSGDDVKVSGFGTFRVRHKKARVGRNPKTGETMAISPRRVVTFKPSEVFRIAVKEAEAERPVSG